MRKSRVSANVAIQIPRPLCDKITAMVEGSNYNSVADFVLYVLRDLVANHEVQEKARYTEAEPRVVKVRLGGLACIWVLFPLLRAYRPWLAFTDPYGVASRLRARSMTLS